MIPGAAKVALVKGFTRVLIATRLDEVLVRVTAYAAPGSLRARLVPDHTQYVAPALKRLRRHGLLFELDVSDYMQWCAYYGLAIEPRAALYGLVTPGQVILDVGANVGETLLNLGRVTGPGGRVYGFEINPRTYQKCARNIALNALQNVELWELGMGHVDAVLTLQMPDPHNSGEDEIGTSDASDGLRVRVTTIDRWVSERALPRVDLIKIDVEGFDLNVLRGAEQTLRTWKPILFVELVDGHLRRHGASARDLIQFVEELGYRAHHAVTERRVRPTDALEAEHFDVICTHRSSS